MTHKYLFSLLVLSWMRAYTSGQGTFTVQVGPPAQPPIPLVRHSDSWRFHKGTNAPAPAWQTNADQLLDDTWATGTGGFGYADNPTEVGLVQTPLWDMRDGYTTFYLRRSFEITNAIDPESPLYLVVDWDDGFVAWLDGLELPARTNAPGTSGTEPAFGAVATAGRESSSGNTSPEPAVTFALGPAGNRLQPGGHTLAILGLNAATNSSDFIMVADLVVGGRSAPGIIQGDLLAIVETNSVVLSGTNTLPGAARVLVEGTNADFNAAAGTWSQAVSLAPGFNRILVQVLDAAGVQLFATNQDIVAELSSVTIGGTMGANTALASSMGVFHVTNSVVVPANGTLAIGPGCVFLFSPGASLLLTNAALLAAGTEDAPVLFAPADGTTAWGGLIAAGLNSHVLGQHLETIAGHIQVLDGATATFEDSYFHDYTLSSPPIIHTLGQPNHCTLRLHRCQVNRYYEILCQLSVNQFEDCLMEHQAPGGDGIDFDGGQPGSCLRRCTVRHGRFTNIDALDMGEFSGTGEPTHGVVIDSCDLYDFVDKGISMGVQVEITVTNCQIHHVDAALAVKDLSVAGIFACTIVSNHYGFHCYNKANPSSSNGGGIITNSFNNVLWDNSQSLSLLNGSTLSASYSDFQNITVPGPGNQSVDPEWRNPAQLDFRLSSTSPLLHAGTNGSCMGASFPVGAPMASSHPELSSLNRSASGVTVRFWADSERSYSLLASGSLSTGTWTRVADIFPAPLPRKTTITDTNSSAPARFYRLVTPRLP